MVRNGRLFTREDFDVLMEIVMMADVVMVMVIVVMDVIVMVSAGVRAVGQKKNEK